MITDLREQLERAEARFGFGNVFPGDAHILDDRVPNGESVPVKVDSGPFQAEDFRTAQAVKESQDDGGIILAAFD